MVWRFKQTADQYTQYHKKTLSWSGDEYVIIYHIYVSTKFFQL